MRKTIWGAIVVAALGGLAASCSNNNNANGPSAGQGGVSGVVTDATTSSPLAGVTISAQPLGASAVSTTTGSDGKYNFTFTIDSTSSVQLAFHVSGYRDTSVVAPLRANSITTQNVAMARRSQISGGGGSGIAQTIAFLGAAPPEIRVKGVGQIETSTLTWEVRDSLGLPIDATHSIQLTFTITNGPGGGEFVSPGFVTTNANGQAIMTLSSGIRAGVVQVTATGTVASGTVTTQPVRVVIDAGFPDQTHFTFGAPLHNIPVLDIFGVHNKVVVLVGDKWSNPVPAGTAVYLSSTAGVVTASIFTDVNGQGSGDIISGNPRPIGSPYNAPAVAGRPFGDGYHYIAARTVGQGAVTVYDSTLMLWSGVAIIANFGPNNFVIQNGGGRSFSFNVWDELHHPLAAGTTISVVASIPPPPDPNAPQNQVIVSFGLNGGITLPDVLTPGAGTTDFTATLSDGNSALIDSVGTHTTLTVFVNGPNGQAAFTIDGTVH